MILKNFADQDWIGFNFIGSGVDSDWKISQSAHLCLWAMKHFWLNAWGVFGLGPLWPGGPRRIVLLDFFKYKIGKILNEQYFCKHAHCALLCIGLIQTLHTWVDCPLLRYRDDCRRESNYWVFLFFQPCWKQ